MLNFMYQGLLDSLLHWGLCFFLASFWPTAPYIRITMKSPVHSFLDQPHVCALQLPGSKSELCKVAGYPDITSVFTGRPLPAANTELSDLYGDLTQEHCCQVMHVSQQEIIPSLFCSAIGTSLLQPEGKHRNSHFVILSLVSLDRAHTFLSVIFGERLTNTIYTYIISLQVKALLFPLGH